MSVEWSEGFPRPTGEVRRSWTRRAGDPAEGGVNEASGCVSDGAPMATRGRAVQAPTVRPAITILATSYARLRSLAAAVVVAVLFAADPASVGDQLAGAAVICLAAVVVAGTGERP